MCGIAGMVRFDDRPIEPGRLAAACGAQRHRGPDHEGVWVENRDEGRIGLAAVRLAVQDPRPQADQPLHDPASRYVLVYNGELYNGATLRAALAEKGWSFRTTGDTEIVLAGCATWDVEALGRFDGMFGLAFYDRRERCGFLARDAFGIKPLIYTVTDAELRFASELGGLRAMGGLDASVDDDALLHYLAFGYIAHPGTIYVRTARLAPGHVLPFTARGAGTPRRWFNLPHTVAQQGTMACLSDRPGGALDYGAAAARLRGRIRSAVVRQRVSDVPLGCFLSGGVDSSIIALHLVEASARPVHTFSIGYAEHGWYDETRHAERVARFLGTHHHAWRLTFRDILSALPEVLDRAAEPFGDSSILPTALVCRWARRKVTVALSGDGADELFGGYWRYLGHAALRGYRRIPAFLRRGVLEPLLSRRASAKGRTGADRVRQWRKLLRAAEGDALDRHLAWARILSPEGERILRDADRLCSLMTNLAVRARTLIDGLPAPRAAGFSPGGDSGAAAAQAFDVQYGLPGDMLHKVDLASMSCSLEVRVPFLDVDVAAAALAMPPAWKMDRGLRKRILTDAYRGLLPDETLDRPKRGFEVPFGELVRGPLLGLFREIVTPKRVSSFSLLSPDGVESVLQAHLRRDDEHGDLLFALLSLCWWARRPALHSDLTL